MRPFLQALEDDAQRTAPPLNCPCCRSPGTAIHLQGDGKLLFRFVGCFSWLIARQAGSQTQMVATLTNPGQNMKRDFVGARRDWQAAHEGCARKGTCHGSKPEEAGK